MGRCAICVTAGVLTLAALTVCWALTPARPDRLLARLQRHTVYIPPATVVLGSRERGAVWPPREVALKGFWMSRHEITVDEYAHFLNENGEAFCPCPDVARRGDRWHPRRGRARYPITHVNHDDADRFCRWLSKKWRRRVRLPTEEEWERAARGDLHGARFPWGWDPPEKRACFGAGGPCRVARYTPNPFGLYDMAGNVYEWCAEKYENGAAVRGGSWAERDPTMLQVFRHVILDPNYRHRDVGFRVVVEAEENLPGMETP